MGHCVNHHLLQVEASNVKVERCMISCQVHRKFKRDNEGISLGRYLKAVRNMFIDSKTFKGENQSIALNLSAKFKYQKCLKVSVGFVNSTMEVADKIQ